MAKQRVPDAAVLAQIPAARRRTERARTNEPHVARATYERAGRQLHLTLSNGTALALPVSLIGSLERWDDADLAEVTVGIAGVGLRWPRRDEDLSAAGLLRAAFGSQSLLRASGAAGGAARSPAKAAAARRNGSKGGRPRKRSPRVVA